jgi:hypothetical protein
MDWSGFRPPGNAGSTTGNARRLVVAINRWLITTSAFGDDISSPSLATFSVLLATPPLLADKPVVLATVADRL